MAINYTTRNNPKKTENKQGIGMKIIYFALNFILVPFSAYQTYQGYENFKGIPLAILLALTTALIFFGLNYTIMQRRLAGINHSKLIIGYLLPLGISFFGNFNSFYSDQIKNQTLSNELSIYSNTFNNTFSAAETELQNSTGVSQLELRVKAELIQLDIQMKQKGKNGKRFGPAAKKKWDEIQAIFNDYNTKFNGGNSSGITSLYNSDNFSKYESASLQYLNSIIDSKQQEIDKILVPIRDTYTEVSTEYDSIIKINNLKKDGKPMLEKLKISNNNYIGSKVKNFLDSKSVQHGFMYTELEDSKEKQIGTIKYSIESAFVKFEEPSATVFSTFFSLLIDFIPLGFLFLVFPYNSNKKRNVQTGPRSL